MVHEDYDWQAGMIRPKKQLTFGQVFGLGSLAIIFAVSVFLSI